MEIKLYSFDEALRKLINKEMPLLIRAKHMKADFINKCVLLYSTEKYVKLSNSGVSGAPDELTQTVLEKTGSTLTESAQIGSDDVLANDYIDSSEWKLFYTAEEYDKEFRR